MGDAILACLATPRQACDIAGEVGRSVSNGCIRMRNEAVMDLFDKVPMGTPVYVY